MSNVFKAKKGDIQVLVNPLTRQCVWVNPSNLDIYVGKVVMNDDCQKKVVSASPKQLGVILSELAAENKELRESNKDLKNELAKFKASYKNTMKGVTRLLEILVPQMELNQLELNDILTNMEERNDEE